MMSSQCSSLGVGAITMQFLLYVMAGKHFAPAAKSHGKGWRGFPGVTYTNNPTWV